MRFLILNNANQKLYGCIFSVTNADMQQATEYIWLLIPNSLNCYYVSPQLTHQNLQQLLHLFIYESTYFLLLPTSQFGRTGTQKIQDSVCRQGPLFNMQKYWNFKSQWHKSQGQLSRAFVLNFLRHFLLSPLYTDQRISFMVQCFHPYTKYTSPPPRTFS